MSDPITDIRLSGLLPSATAPSGLLYPLPANSYAAGGVFSFVGWLQYRAANPAASIGGIVSVTALDANLVVSGGTLTTTYDQTNNLTTILMQHGSENVQIVVPLNLQCLADLKSKGFASLSSAQLTAGVAFSGTINGFAYQGVAAYIYASGVAVPGYFFTDASGRVMFATYASTSPGITIFCPGDGPMLPYVPIAPGLSYPASPTGVTGTFSQTKNGQTFTGSFTPRSLLYSTFDSSLEPENPDSYWLTH